MKKWLSGLGLVMAGFVYAVMWPVDALTNTNLVVGSDFNREMIAEFSTAAGRFGKNVAVFRSSPHINILNVTLRSLNGVAWDKDRPAFNALPSAQACRVIFRQTVAKWIVKVSGQFSARFSAPIAVRYHSDGGGPPGILPNNLVRVEILYVINGYEINGDVCPKLLLGGFAGDINRFSGSLRGFASFPSGPKGRSDSYQHKDNFNRSNYELIAREGYKFLSADRHSALRVKVLTGVIIGVVTGLLVFGGFYFWCGRNRRGLGLGLLLCGFGTLLVGNVWALGVLG